MDKAIDKGNLIDFFAVLVPGMFSVIFCCAMNLNEISSIMLKNSLSSLTAFITAFIIGSYISGLLLMEIAVIFQTLFPSLFDYYREAIKKDVLKGKNAYLLELWKFKYVFIDDLVSKDIIIEKIEQQEKIYENKEFWLLTHNYAELVERKKAYSMMNRSLAMAPIACMFVQAFFIYVINQGVTWPVWWKLVLICLVEAVFYHRARRQANLHYHEVNKIYESVKL